MLPLLLLLSAYADSPQAALAAVSAPVPVTHQARLRPGLRRYRPGRCCVTGAIEGSAPLILPDLVRRLTQAFATHEPGAKVSVPPPYEPPQGKLSSRLRAFLEGRLDFAFLTRELSSSDRETFRRSHGFDPVAVPVANGSWRTFGFVDPVVILVNERNPIAGLSFAQVDAIFSESRRRRHPPVSYWGDLGLAPWAGRPINIIGGSSWRGEDSARGGVMRERVMLGGRWRRVGAGSGTEADVPARVAADPLAIGFTGLGHVVPGTRAVPISAGRGGDLTPPSFEAVVAGRYPLTRTVDLLVRRRPGTCLRPAVRAFVDFLLSREGQEIVRDSGVFLPLRAPQAERARRLAGRCD